MRAAGYIARMLRPLCAAHTQRIRRDEEGDRGDPGSGVGDADARKSPQPHEEEGGNDAPRQLRDTREGGDKAPADALQRVAIDVDGAEKEIEGTLPEQVLPAVGDHLFIVRRDVGAQICVEKETHERLAQPHVKDKGKCYADNAVQHPDEDALADTAEVARAVVLPRIRRHGGADRNKGLRGDAVDLGGGGVRRDNAGQGRIQPVKRRLLHDAADRRDGELQRHGKTLRQVRPREADIPGKVPLGRPQERIAADGDGKAERARNELGKHRGDRRARIVHVEREDE